MSMTLGGIQVEVSDERQVVGSDESRTASVWHQALQLQTCIKIIVIQVKKRNQARISPRAAQMSSDIHTLKVGREDAGSQATRPFVEIPKDDPHSLQFYTIQDPRAD